jgi:pilus assembly protein FimV
LVQWRVVRDYTMLLDPPEPAGTRCGDAGAAAGHRGPAAPAAQAVATHTAPVAPRQAATTCATQAGSPQRPRQPRRRSGENRVTVKAGDTASKIARSNKPAQVSLDQMLVALLRNNEGAFIGGNLNRLKAGSPC